MFQGRRVAAVVPAYREEKLIGKVITTMPELVDHIVVVDDASPDRTAEAARAVGDPRVTVMTLEQNRGVGGAVLAGHARALELGAEVNVVMAGDAQMDPAYLPQLLTPVTVGGYGFAKANRFFSAESFAGMPAYRVLGNVLLSFMTKLASGYWHLFDPQNGYTAIRRDVLERLPLGRIARRYSFENDLLINLNILRVPAVDVPIPAVYGDEVSSIRLRTVVPELLRLLTRGFARRVWMRYILSSFSPVALFLLVGGLFSLVGALISVWVGAHTLGPPVATTGSVLLAVVPLLLGAQLLMFALVLDIQESPDRPEAPLPPAPAASPAPPPAPSPAPSPAGAPR